MLLLTSGFLCLGLAAQDSIEMEDSITVNGLTLYGTLTLPVKSEGPIPIALIIPGSGPTDRNCNSAMGFKTDAFKKMATYFAGRKIATLRYDKRGVGQSVSKKMNEGEMRFEDLVTDAKAWIAKLQSDDRFKKVVVIGHSEGSLVGMLSLNGTCKFVSIAGIAENPSEIIKNQIKDQSGDQWGLYKKQLDSVRNGQTVKPIGPIGMALFRESVQPYLMSWFKYTPSEVFANIPSRHNLLVQGTNDIQVPVNQAELLHKANGWSQLYLVEDMNHVMVETKETDQREHLKTYNQPELPLSQAMLAEIEMFIFRVE